jgi:hypothetical protein
MILLLLISMNFAEINHNNSDILALKNKCQPFDVCPKKRYTSSTLV